MSRLHIESLGVYLPEARLTTAELIARCRRRPRWDIERITGIRERRVVARDEHALDLALAAARRALAASRHPAESLDAVICTSISKHHADDEFSFEPATATAIRAALGLRAPLAFDVVNACAGIFTGLRAFEGLLAAGAARRALVVSGEQNSCIAETATREIRGLIDPQFAALTIGDAGAALVVDAEGEGEAGFHSLELVSGARWNRFCSSRPSRRGRGGILETNARGLQRKGAEHFPFYLKRAVERGGWSLGEIEHIIAHQISPRGIRRGRKELLAFLGADLPVERFLDVSERTGNTTTTSHWVALDEALRDGRVREGQRLLFVSGASGIVITHATYLMDDLAARLRAAAGGAP